jgi:hypothetical protein
MGAINRSLISGRMPAGENACSGAPAVRQAIAMTNCAMQPSVEAALPFSRGGRQNFSGGPSADA